MHSYILLDQSGSMSTRWTEAISSINSYVKGLVEATGEFNVTVATFDTHASFATAGIAGTVKNNSTFNIIRNNMSVKNWKDITDTEVQPRGGTPLYDAVGKIVTLANSQSPEKAVFVIMTDGEENSSTEYTRESAKALLESCDKKNWQTVFLGADFNNEVQTKSLGRNYLNSISASSLNLASTMASTARMASAYASAGTAMNYTDLDRAEAIKDSANSSDVLKNTRTIKVKSKV